MHLCHFYSGGPRKQREKDPIFVFPQSSICVAANIYIYIYIYIYAYKKLLLSDTIVSSIESML